MNRRILAVREMVANNQLDAVMVTKQENWQYLSGFTGSNAVLLLTAKENYLITDFRYIDQATAQAGDFQVVKPSVLVEEKVAELVNQHKLHRLGFEDQAMSFRTYSEYQTRMAGIDLVPLSEQLEQIRWVKDQDETACLTKAAHITDEAFSHIVKFIKPGISEADIALEIEYFMRKNGAHKSAFDIIIASGPRGALPHGVATDKKLAAGELVVMDFGAVYNGYHADMTRTVVIGKADNRQKEIYRIVLEAQEQAIRAIKPGITCSAVDTVARDLIAREGYGANFGHGLGHSVGLEIHEKPSFSPRDKTVLMPGMAMTVEPGIYLTNWGGVRIEDLVTVTPEGVELLSASPKELLEL